MAPKTNSKENFCSAMGASTWFLCVTFYVFLQNFTSLTQKPGKSHKLGKTGQNMIWAVFANRRERLRENNLLGIV